mgnify:FL=1
MLCDKCFKNIKLKFLFYFKSITSNAIYYMKEQMISISETRTDNIKNWSMIDDDDGYGQYYDTETNCLCNEEIKQNKYNPDPLDEYLDRYEQNMIQQENPYKYIQLNEHPILYFIQNIIDISYKLLF